MPMRDDILLKIQRAEKHINELHVIMRAFIDSNPYAVSVKTDPKAGQKIYYLAKDADIPDDVALIAGDVLQNIRSALDYLAWRLVDVNGGNPGKHTQFPIFDGATQYQSGFSGQVKGMRQEAIDILHKIKPYNGGDDTLWRLHRLNNIDKHRLVFTVAARIRSFDILQHFDASDPSSEHFVNIFHSVVSGINTGDWQGTLNRSFPLKAGDVLWIDPPDAKVNDKIKFAIDIVLNEPGICEGEPLILVLRSSWQRVLRVCQRFEAWL